MFWNRRSKKISHGSDTGSDAKRHPGEVPRAGDPPPLPSLSWEPDYSALPPLHLSRDTHSVPSAPLVIIGLGSFGGGVLCKLREYLNEFSIDTGSIEMMRITLDAQSSECDAESLLSESCLEEIPTFSLQLPVDSITNYPWYKGSGSWEITRSDARVALFQELNLANPRIWDAIARRVGNGKKPDVWLVSSAFDPVGSGLIFDIAHLARLVGGSHRFYPLIGWLVALPGEEWGSTCVPAGMAFLREWTRLVQEDSREYEYNESADNTLLRRNVARGGEDCDILFAMEPRVEDSLFSFHEDQRSMEIAATLLMLLSQKDVWDVFKDDIGRIKSDLKRLPSDARVPLGTFGLSVHHLPLRSIKEQVRFLITYDVLFDEKRGLLKRVSKYQVEPDEDGAKQVFQDSGHPLLQAIARGDTIIEDDAAIPTENIDSYFVLALRKHLQEAVDRPDGKGLAGCYSLLQGVEELLDSAASTSAYSDVIDCMRGIISRAKKEMDLWERWARDYRERAEAKRDDLLGEGDPSSNQEGQENINVWKRVRTNIVSLYEDLTNKSRTDVRDSIREYVRWAWVVEKGNWVTTEESCGRLHLYLDTLYPGWEETRPDWRHTPQESLQRLDEMIASIVTAWTNEPEYWPTSLWTDDGDDIDKVDLLLRPGKFSSVKWANEYIISGDAHWLSEVRGKYPHGSGIKQVNNRIETLGAVLRWQIPISLDSITFVNKNVKRYRNAGKYPERLHIFWPEQQALRLEYSSRHVPDIERVRWLSEEVVSAIKRWDCVKAFVVAWLNGKTAPLLQMLEDKLPKTASPLDECIAFASSDNCSSIAKQYLGSDRPSEEAFKDFATSYENAEHRSIKDVEWYILTKGVYAEFSDKDRLFLGV